VTKQEIQEWLVRYAWLGTPDAQEREVACIMSQDDWTHLEVRKEHLRGQASGEETNLEEDVTEHALSALYECHGGPHLDTCPRS
jgi:hypothetical protein